MHMWFRLIGRSVWFDSAPILARVIPWCRVSQHHSLSLLLKGCRLLMGMILQRSFPVLGPQRQQDRPKVSESRFRQSASTSGIDAAGARPRINETLLVTDGAKQWRDRNALIESFKPCGKEKDIERARRLHADAVQKELVPKDIYVTTALLSTYVRCGALREAEKVFEQITVRDDVSWNALISGYAQHALGHEAIKRFRQMQDQGISPGAVTFLSVLKACGCVGSLKTGEEIHAVVTRLLLVKKDIVLGGALVDMYGKCGVPEKAQKAFEELPERNVVTWTALIAAYAQQGLGDEAMKCFQQMQAEGVSPNSVTYVCILKACSSIACLEMGEEIHAIVKEQGLLLKDVVLGTSLVDWYAKIGFLGKAREIFEELPVRNIVSWTALISGYVEHEFGDEALKCFSQMQTEGIRPNVVTYVCVLKACATVGRWEMGEEIHAEVKRFGLLSNDVVLGNALVDMYCKCGLMEKAQAVFEELPVRNVVGWTALITGYAQHGYANDAVQCFRKMNAEGVVPNVVTFVSILKACSSIESLEIGEEIHAEARSRGLLAKDIILGTALLDLYAKCGMLGKAREVFEELLVQDAVSWNALIDGYTQHGYESFALECFKQMQAKGVSPDSVTFISVMKACGSMGHHTFGEELHFELRKQGLLEKDVVLCNGLVDMYGKCGFLERAKEIFEMLPIRDSVSWNVLMAGYAQLGKAKEVLDLFSRMRADGVVPNLITLLVLISACSHAGLIEEGQTLFHDIRIVHNLTPTLEHFTCMVDLYGRAGQFDKARDVLNKVQPSDQLPLLMVLLGACHKWVNVDLARWVFEQFVRLDQNHAASAYVSMRNIYAAADICED